MLSICLESQKRLRLLKNAGTLGKALLHLQLCARQLYYDRMNYKFPNVLIWKLSMVHADVLGCEGGKGWTASFSPNMPPALDCLAD